MAKRRHIPKRKRIPKQIDRQLADLDHQLRILREQLHSLSEGDLRLKVLSASLRVLLCRSGGTEGLNWRLCRKLRVSDQVHVHITGDVQKDHPHAKGLHFALKPYQRVGHGPVDLPATKISFEKLITTHKPIFLAGEELSHDYLIKAVAQQMGLGHEDDSIEIPIAQLEQIFINGVQPFVPILALDSEFALEIGERVLEKAKNDLGFNRPDQGEDYGNLSVVVRLVIREQFIGRAPLFTLRSDIADAAIAVGIGPSGVNFTFIKRGKKISEIEAPFPDDWKHGTDAMFVLSYCSSAQMVKVVAAPNMWSREAPCPMDWLHASEMSFEEEPEQSTELFYLRFIAQYEKLMSSKDVKGLYELKSDQWGNWWSPDGQSLFLTEQQSKNRGVFPC